MAEKNIPGIYNYCDRWCERCYFASRCAVYENESGLSPEQTDITNKAFWDKLSENFAKTRDLLDQAAKHFGINLEEAMKAGEEIESKSTAEEDSKNHPLAVLSLEYSKISRDWLHSQPGMMAKLEALRDGLEMGTASVKNAKETTAMIKESVDVIAWYHAFIHIKLMRALMGRLRQTEFDFGLDDDPDYQPDYDGSAKIAVIAIERSMQCWIKLYDLLPDEEDYFLKLLSMLERLKSMTVLEFPNAMAFKRPGFDDEA